MDSFSITCSGTELQLKSVFSPPIELNGDYVIGLVDFQSYNSIFNVKSPLNNLYYHAIEKIVTPKGKDISIGKLNEVFDGKIKIVMKDNIAYINTHLKLVFYKGLVPKLYKLTEPKITIEENLDVFYYNHKVFKEIIIPEGSYEVSEIGKEVQKQFPDFNLTVDNRTMRATLVSNSAVFDFTKASLGTALLGFYGVTSPGVPFSSIKKVNINNVNVIRVQCNIANGSFLNGNLSHTIHSFYPDAPPGYKIIEVPRNILYFPVNKRTLDTVTISFADQ